MDLRNKNKNLKCARYSWTSETGISTTEVLNITKFLMSEEEAGIAFCGHRNWTQTWCESCDAKGHKLDKKVPDLRKSQGWHAAIIPFILL